MENPGDGIPDASLSHHTLQETQVNMDNSEQVDGNSNSNSGNNSMTMQAPVSEHVEHVEHAEDDDMRYEPGAQVSNEIHALAPTARSPRHDPDSLFVPESSPTPPNGLNQQDDLFGEPIREHEDQIDYPRQLEASNTEQPSPRDEVELENAMTVEATGTRKRGRDDEEQLSEHESEEPSPREPDQSMQDAELERMKEALELQGDAPPKKKRKTASSGPHKSKPMFALKGRKTGKRCVQNANKQTKKNMELAIKQAKSLFNSNVFDQQAGPDAPDQPTFESKNKRNALKVFIKSLPPGLQKKARQDYSYLIRATTKFDGGRGAVKIDPDNYNYWTLRGFKTSLKSYQVLGVSFMRERENSPDEPKGGIMADQMGLGKTVMVLASMTNGQPSKKAKGPKATLIVASPAILSQWQNEIDRHSKFIPIRFRSSELIQCNDPLERLNGYDIVLTTYREILNSYPKNEPPEDYITKEEKDQWWEETLRKSKGILHEMEFLRVVLDEAQAIKNHESRTSIACRALKAKHKWALSGTPIQNSLTELYPYFDFIGVPDTGDFVTFQEEFCDPENSKKLLEKLSRFMIRRTHEDQMFGAPILKLPQATQATYWCEFNPVERCIYDIVRERFEQRIKVWSNNGKLKNSYRSVLVMFLRLRQLASHILMLQFVMRDLLEREDIERIQNVVNTYAADPNNKNTVISVQKQLERVAADEKKRREDSEAHTIEDDESGKDMDADEETGLTEFETGGRFGNSFNFKPYLKTLKKGKSWERAKQGAKCSRCDKKPESPMITSCGHIVCMVCQTAAFLEAAEHGYEKPACVRCGIIPEFVEPCDAPATATTRKKRGRKQARDDIIDKDWLAAFGDDVLPSAKTIAVKSQILNLLREDPHTKIIVYTQFLAIIRILAQVCRKEGWKAQQYHGKMSTQARERVISSFGTQSDSRILLASLHCGGLGLNLTMASKVILVDPWWNNSVEQQAFCRVFRFGQDKETYMIRFCVKDSIDQRIMEIQDRKEREIDAVMKSEELSWMVEALGGGSGNAAGNLPNINSGTDVCDGFGDDGADEEDSSDDS